MAVVRTADSEVPDVGDGLWERVRDAVQAESSADTSLWNGQIDYTEEPGTRGEAWDNGRICFNQESVVQPLQDMYATQGQPATAQQWVLRRNALKTVAHEFSHLASPDGYTHGDRLAGMKLKGTRPLEEGVTEAWSQAAVDRLADRVLPPDMAEQVKAVREARGGHSYPGWEPAARAFADEVGADAGVEGDEVLSRMAKEPRTTKARAAADLLYDASDLPELVPAEQEEAVRQEIAGTIDKGFADLQPLNDKFTATTRAESAERGLGIAESASDVVRAAEERYRGAPEQQVQQEETLDLGALPPPNPADRIPTREEPTQQSTAEQPGEQRAVDPRVAYAQQREAPQAVEEAQPVDPRVAYAQQSGAASQQPGSAQERPVDPRVAFAQLSPAQQQAQLQAGSQQGGSEQAGATQRSATQQSAGVQAAGHPGEQDVAALRGVLEDQPSAAGAPRVPQGEAAEGRRPTGHGAATGRHTENTPAR
ncbi:hypothetical protein E1263_37880 [Kribbella antibiotica]|uniref:Uncharacterized protein n=1 Tax=Kribbella antibiotica TaxID=190195 RepID=A0A4R4YL92_9ACTN|nr:hypothetical protein [Kribbella antibiotica]TDD45778.1 hypothetical protein E1263_37880 [Kribbella antibiotica]